MENQASHLLSTSGVRCDQCQSPRGDLFEGGHTVTLEKRRQKNKKSNLTCQQHFSNYRRTCRCSGEEGVGSFLKFQPKEKEDLMVGFLENHPIPTQWKRGPRGKGGNAIMKDRIWSVRSGN